MEQKGCICAAATKPLLHIPTLDASRWRSACWEKFPHLRGETVVLVCVIWLNTDINRVHRALVQRVPRLYSWQPLVERWPGNRRSVTGLSYHEWVYSVCQLLVEFSAQVSLLWYKRETCATSCHDALFSRPQFVSIASHPACGGCWSGTSSFSIPRVWWPLFWHRLHLSKGHLHGECVSVCFLR